MEGEVLEKEKAKNIYEDIVRRAKDPGLLEYINSRLFQVRIFPIPPLGEQKVEIEYTEVLKADKGLYEYNYSMKTSTNKGEFRDPDMRFAPMKSSFDISVKNDAPIVSLYSPSHKISQKNINNKETKVIIDDEPIDENRDIKIFIQSSEKDYGISLVPYRPYKNEPGYFMMLISPKQDIKNDDIEPKAVTFVLDTSGSMLDNDKIIQAKKALEFCLMNLGTQDFFNILSFSTNINTFSEKSEPADDTNKDKAKKYIKDLKAIGGTNIYEALQTALKMETPKNMLHVIIFITDGLPTIGITNPDQIVADAQNFNSKNLRVFTFGVGYDVNTHLLDTIADKTNAFSEYIMPKEDMEVKISNFYSKIQNPVMTNLNIDVKNIKISDIYPKQIPDLFSGSQIILFGRYEKDGDAEIVLKGMTKGNEQKNIFTTKFPAKEDDNEFIEKLWGTRKIAYLLDEIRKNGENEETKNEVIALAKKYNVVTPYTSYLVVEDEADNFAGINERRNIITSKDNPKMITFGRGKSLPPESKAQSYTYYDSSASGITQSKAMASMPAAPSGRQAVEMSQNITELKKITQISDSDIQLRRKNVSGKIFYLSQSGEWTDEETDKTKKEENKTVKIKSFSKGYFELFNKKPELKEILSIGDKVKFIYNGWLIIIGDTGEEELPKNFADSLK